MQNKTGKPGKTQLLSSIRLPKDCGEETQWTFTEITSSPPAARKNSLFIRVKTTVRHARQTSSAAEVPAMTVARQHRSPNTRDSTRSTERRMSLDVGATHWMKEALDVSAGKRHAHTTPEHGATRGPNVPALRFLRLQSPQKPPGAPIYVPPHARPNYRSPVGQDARAAEDSISISARLEMLDARGNKSSARRRAHKQRTPETNQPSQRPRSPVFEDLSNSDSSPQTSPSWSRGDITAAQWQHERGCAGEYMSDSTPRHQNAAGWLGPDSSRKSVVFATEVTFADASEEKTKRKKRKKRKSARAPGGQAGGITSKQCSASTRYWAPACGVAIIASCVLLNVLWRF